jgi:hypothetical protein
MSLASDCEAFCDSISSYCHHDVSADLAEAGTLWSKELDIADLSENSEFMLLWSRLGKVMKEQTRWGHLGSSSAGFADLPKFGGCGLALSSIVPTTLHLLL